MKGLCHYCFSSNVETHLELKGIIRCEKCRGKIKKDVPKNEPKLLPFQDLPTPTANELQLAMERIEEYNIKCHEEYAKKHQM